MPKLSPFDTLDGLSTSAVALVPPSLLPPGVFEAGQISGMYIATDGRQETARRVAARFTSMAPGLNLAPGGGRTPYLGTAGTGVWLLPLFAYVLVLAACALCIVTVDGIFDRRRSLAALRAAGAGPAVLRRATMLEIAGPLLVVGVLGAVSGAATGIAFVVAQDGSLRPAWSGLAISAALLVGLWLMVTDLSLPAVTRASSLRELRTT